MSTKPYFYTKEEVDFMLKQAADREAREYRIINPREKNETLRSHSIREVRH
jgi:hypothetical protein